MEFWRGGRAAEGAPLLREYGGNSIEGSNPSLSEDIHKVTVEIKQDAPVAQLDRVSGYEPEGREFESLRARQISNTIIPTSTLILRNTTVHKG